MTTEFESPAWVVVSTPAWRGWRARAGGEELAVAIADHALVAFRAPAGRAEIELRFRPRSFDVGLALSAATAAALVAAGWRRRARRPR